VSDVGGLADAGEVEQTYRYAQVCKCLSTALIGDRPVFPSFFFFFWSVWDNGTESAEAFQGHLLVLLVVGQSLSGRCHYGAGPGVFQQAVG
jgi:hypothetical protein